MFNRSTALTHQELKSAIVREPLIIPPSATVMDAIAQMSGVRTLCDMPDHASGQLDDIHLEARSSCVLVVEGMQLLGILTERDVVRLSAQQCSLEHLTLREVMTQSVITLQESAFNDLFFAVNLFQQYHIRHLPILDEQDRLVGLVTHESLRQISRPVDLLRLRQVSEVMTSEVICAPPDSSMLTIVQQMAAHRISSIMIVQPGGTQAAPLQIPIGILTERDIVQFQALGLGLETCLAQAVMSTPIFAVKPNESLWVVQQIMEQRLIRRVAVTGEQGELLGIVTQTSLLQVLNPLEIYKLAEVLEEKVVLLEAEKLQLLEDRTLELERQIESRTLALKLKAEREQLVNKLAMQIRSSLSLQTILDTTVEQVRQVLGCERVNIWRFEADWQTVVVAESTNSPVSLIGRRISDHCFGQEQADRYCQGGVRVVSDIYNTEMTDCHRELLIRFQTRAKILVPLLCGDALWGVLNVAESQHPRQWRQDEVELLQALSVQLAIALQQATTYQQLQDQLNERQQAEARLRESEAHQRALIRAIPDLITRVNQTGIYLEFVATPNFQVVGNLPEIVGTHVFETLPLEPAQKRMEGIQRALETNAIQMYEQDLSMNGRMQVEEVRIVPYSTDEVLILVRDITDRKRAERQLYQLNQDLEVKVKERTAKLQEREAELQKLSERLALSLKSGEIGCWEWDIQKNTLLWDERMYELYNVTLQPGAQLGYDIWANRLHPADRTPTEALLQQTVSGRAEYDTEFRVVHTNGSIHFIKACGVVVRDPQGNPQSLIGINFDISDRKQAEQATRQQAEREKLLREITQRIRQSLDLQTIFDTACEEIRPVIQADRVGIFKFYPESQFDDGEFVAESIVEGIPSVVAIRVHDHCFGKNYSALYAKGRFYAIDDIYKNGIERCHSRVLAQFQVRANLVVPLMCGDELWGLLCIHQCEETRYWQQSEIDFTQQIATQLAIAIQQANLYEQIQAELVVRQQAEAKIAMQLRRQQTLGTIIQQIRESLDINEILTTVTHQVKDMLQGDRVIVFRLFPDGRSKIVEESVSEEFPILKNRYWDDEVWSQDILECYWQGKPRIVPDVMDDVWTKCLVEYSAEGQIQSKIVAPILQEVRHYESHRWVAPWETNKLWGVLVVHACREKRVWREIEAQLLQQIANQLAIAIQQANLFEQLQQELTDRQQAQQQLTERNQQLAVSNQELARATRLKDEFLANMSHELRTPLNAILGMTEGLQENVFGQISNEQIKALQTIERSGSHLLALINDILDVAKIEAGQIELNCAPVAVAPLCQSSLSFIKQQALQKTIQLEIKLPCNLPDLLVDERRIRQVLINLLNNAVKFTLAGGCITLEVSPLPQKEDPQRQEYLRISVMDTGIGIATEHIDKLFQPFIQIDSALNRQYTGTGLGLTLVKRIVELHGGRIGLTSEVGVGSCFIIDLPCMSSITASAASQRLLETNLKSAQFEPASSSVILLAEDNEANISTLSSYLGAKGYQIVVARNGQAAIDLAKQHQPDLILMDIQMPGIDGLEATRQIRLDPTLAKVPIIALTALVMTGDRERCLAAGANDYLAKPVRLNQLASTIQGLLQRVPIE